MPARGSRNYESLGVRTSGVDYSETPSKDIPFTPEMLDRALWAYQHERTTIERLLNGTDEISATQLQAAED